jgi:hypothetical protein
MNRDGMKMRAGACKIRVYIGWTLALKWVGRSCNLER